MKREIDNREAASSTRQDRDRTRAERNAREIEIINRNADLLNADALDGLDDQASLDDEQDEVP
jgi:hypothetical protein